MNQSSTVSTGRSTIRLNRIKTYFSKPHNVILLIMGIVLTVTTVAPIIAIVQAAIVNAPLIPFQVFTWIGDMFSCVPFPPLGWVAAIVLAFTMIPVDLIRKAVTKQESHDLIEQSK